MFYADCNANLNNKSNCKDQDDQVVISPKFNIQSILENEREELLERNQVLSLQQKRFKPISTGMFFLIELAMMVPLLNVVLLFVWSFNGKTNSNKRAFARATLIWIGLLITVFLIFLVTLLFMEYPLSISYWFYEFKDYINSIDL